MTKEEAEFAGHMIDSELKRIGFKKIMINKNKYAFHAKIDAKKGFQFDGEELLQLAFFCRHYKIKFATGPKKTITVVIS